MVDKEIPIPEQYPDKSRLGLYRLHDRCLAFWFKYVFPCRSRIEIGNAGYLLGKINETFEQHLSFAQEEVCRVISLHLLKAGIMDFSAIGRWWAKHEEIDLAALSDESKNI